MFLFYVTSVLAPPTMKLAEQRETAAADATRTKGDLWLKWLIISSCVVFILVLALSAVFEPSIRLLHAFQALIYVAVIILAVRHNAWGYGAGCLIAAFWNWLNLVHTTFIANGVRELSRALQTGRCRIPTNLSRLLLRPPTSFLLVPV